MEIKDGIDRNAHNRSGMLWEVERILKERVKFGLDLPKFLLMENVSTLLRDRHRANFEEWMGYLKKIGYTNQVYTLNSNDFGIPQKRIRTYMISVLTKNSSYKEEKVLNFFKTHNLADIEYSKKTVKARKSLKKDIIKADYKIVKYKKEADECQPNDTPSRREIFNNSDILYSNNKVHEIVVSTVTTKQDRYPNSGLLEYANNKKGKSNYRFLTPRECFLLMGFDESDFDSIVKNNFSSRRNVLFFTRDKLYKMAGNSIVVDVLERIFEQVIYIDKKVLNYENEDSYNLVKDSWEQLYLRRKSSKRLKAI